MVAAPFDVWNGGEGERGVLVVDVVAARAGGGTAQVAEEAKVVDDITNGSGIQPRVATLGSVRRAVSGDAALELNMEELDLAIVAVQHVTAPLSA
ncbi:hypothetical protein [Kibdelosporangium phytohabitans]|uniref:Uncharacterized protein n=1 Tax=Kibdelosporangium phytohabitans TaxID=860235 RepID=A0A0N9I6N7_9PSEU|nr:hypothetical protein [Kibdelosporangium phytohabitans]ALG10116.1 hypothetical protein AOZ06_27325 [Kibdelosporangium phytohabitans]MBE1461101.1 hypothetical protein [Kibdelosporangium phytohabitans]